MASQGDLNSLAQAKQPNSALALVAPPEFVPLVQPIRSLYDQAAVKWPPHINIFYPFVSVDVLHLANDIITNSLGEFNGLLITFDRAEAWQTGSHWTIVLRPDENTEERFAGIYQILSQHFPLLASSKHHRNGAYKMHLTLAQMQSKAMADAFLVKLEKLHSVLGQTSWFLSSLTRNSGIMRIQKSWGGTLNMDMSLSHTIMDGHVSMNEAFCYSSDQLAWIPVSATSHKLEVRIKNFTVSTYNCMFSPESTSKDESVRFRQLLSNIINTNSAAICLQEVSDSFLTSLLHDSKIRQIYRFSSHSPEQPLLYMQNCVILSCYPFSVERLVVDRKRSITIASFRRAELQGETHQVVPLVLAAVHLPAHLTGTAVAAKVKYASLLEAYLQEHYPQAQCIVAGDFNIASFENQQRALEARHIEGGDLKQLNAIFEDSSYIDTWNMWQDAGTVLQEPYTFDPFTNKIAMANVLKFSKLPPSRHRYDRILIRKEGSEGILIRDVRIFGQPDSINDQLASDHWGITAFLRVGQQSLDTDQTPLVLPETTFMDHEIRKHLEEEHLLPGTDERQERLQALQVLKQCLRGNPASETQVQPWRDGTFKMELAAVGSFGLGTWDSESDIDCLVIGNISLKTFWKLAREKIKLWKGSESIKVVRFVNSTIPMLILLVNDKIRVDLQYCTAVNLVDIWPSLPTLSPIDPLYNLPLTTLKKLQAFRDMNHLLLTLPNLPNFRFAYMFLKRWATLRGIYSSKFGYIGGIHITLLLSRICLLLPANATITQILHTFFSQYARWNWAQDSVLQPNVPKKIRYQRSAREKMVILTINAPAVNVALNATKHTVHVLDKELNVVNKGITESKDWITRCLRKNEASALFLQDFDRYIKIDIQFWGSNKPQGRALVGWIESRCVMLLTDLANKVPSIAARIWPRRFHEVPSLPINIENQASELRGFYLIGVTIQPEIHDKDKKRMVETAFAETLRSFEDAVKNSYQGKFDDSTSWLQVRCVKRDQLCEQDDHKVVEDNTGIWDGGVGEDGESDDDAEEDDDDSPENDEESNTLPIKSSSQVQKLHKSSNLPTPKLRPSSDVLARIKWDASYDVSDFMVGYEDRFRGVIEIEVTSWKTDNTHEEFVPMHRVVYFRRKSDNVKIWDRAAKIDMVFGSGVTDI